VLIGDGLAFVVLPRGLPRDSPQKWRYAWANIRITCYRNGVASHTTSPQTMTDDAPSTVGEYEVVREIGKGSFAQVYCARTKVRAFACLSNFRDLAWLRLNL